MRGLISGVRERYSHVMRGVISDVRERYSHVMRGVISAGVRERYSHVMRGVISAGVRERYSHVNVFWGGGTTNGAGKPWLLPSTSRLKPYSPQRVEVGRRWRQAVSGFTPGLGAHLHRLWLPGCGKCGGGPRTVPA